MGVEEREEGGVERVLSQATVRSKLPPSLSLVSCPVQLSFIACMRVRVCPSYDHARTSSSSTRCASSCTSDSSWPVRSCPLSRLSASRNTMKYGIAWAQKCHREHIRTRTDF